MHIESILLVEHDEIKEGRLVDASGKHIVAIRNFIPRFVEGTNYTNSFGLEWNRYRALLIDRENGLSITADRFYSCTGWSKEELRGLQVLEIGCGAGRFTQIMLEAGARVYSCDISSAVDACFNTNGPNDNLCVLQADLFQIPCRTESFDRVFCYGVLQHTPNPQDAFNSLIPFLRRGGKLSVDCYIKQPLFTRWTSKYLWRPFTTRIRPELLLKLVEWYIPKWLPIDTKLARIPRFGKRLVGLIPCWNYTGILPLDPKQITQWAVLDTFDALASKYDKPQTLDEIANWFRQADLSDVQVKFGANGIVGNGSKPR
jgi:2-polyprenyl-3-methyl-5-hydroxy-6-metoxy-1,4-benzoquinol methylase